MLLLSMGITGSFSALLFGHLGDGFRLTASGFGNGGGGEARPSLLQQVWFAIPEVVSCR